MLLVETQPTSPTPAFDPASNFRLRIRSDGTNQQLVELRPGKTTIGSSPRCDIRIGRPGVQPLHCLILFESGGLSVRRWAAGTRLNGQAFDEAPLGPGDRLAVGDAELELEIVGPDLAAAKTESPWSDGAGTPASETSSNQPAAPSFESWGGWNSAQLTELSGERQNDAFPQSGGAGNVLPAHQAVGTEQWRAQPDSVDQFKGRLTVFHEQLSQLEVKLASWKDARDDWQQECAEWRAEREQAHRQWCELERQIAELQSRASEIVGRIERLEHSMAAQALVPKFEATRVELQQPDEQTEPVIESPPTFEPATNSSPSFEELATTEVDLAAEPKPDTEDELAPFAEFSIWRQGAAGTTSGPDQSDVTDNPTEPSVKWAPETAVGRESSPVDNSWQMAPAKSFIEQYGHMFADDGIDTEQSSAMPSSSPAGHGISDGKSIVGKTQNHGRVQSEVDTPPASTSEDEESIEQYMSKLLQRVRGDRPAAGPFQAGVGNSPSRVSVLPTGFQPGATHSATTSGQVVQPTENELSRAGANGDWFTTSLGTVRRKAQIIEQPADMEKLRAVANESARRAISTHGLRVHRRNAITKVIVSTLAGMTSLWMMLAAPHWQDLQFITACVSLIVAAYWAGQTYAELIDAFRAAAYDGPEDQLQGFAEPLPAALPIDVESSAKS